MESTLLVAVLILLAAWSTVLTVLVLRRGACQWEPVYRRLPDGRIRFAWSVARSYETTCRAQAVEAAGSHRP